MKGDFSRTTFDRSRHYRRVLQQQGRVHVDADWNEAQDIGAYVRETAARDTIGLPGSPSANAGFAIGVDGLATDLTISAGRLFVDGVMCENDALAKLSAQPDLPLAGGGFAGYTPPALAGRFLVYLDAWERYVSALLDPAIRETALGGPDTAGRAKLVWQVKLEAVGAAQTSDDFDAAWSPKNSASTGTMFAQTDPAPPGGPCVLPPLAGYRLLTNQLYRVEIHQGGWLGTPPPGYSGGTPTFKWSRDNGTVASVVAGIAGQSITIAQVGPDVAASFIPGQWVELIDARSELTNQHGQLLLISSVAPQTGTIVIDASTAVAAVDLTTTVLLRRWEQVGNAAAAAAGVPLSTGKTALDPGISVNFTEGGYRAGDYWTFPARTAIDAETGTITWPGGNAPLPAQGIAHHYAALALVDFDAGRKTYSLVEDCRTVFDPLTGRFPPFRVRWNRSGTPVALVAGQNIALDALQAGLSIGTAVALDPASISPGSVALVADIPVTYGRLMGTSDARVVGTQPLTVACDIQMLGTNRFSVTPSAPASELLAQALSPLSFSGNLRVQDVFTTTNFAASAAWAFTADGFLSPTPFEPWYGMRAAAIARTALDGTVSHIGATVVPNSSQTMKAGVVFNAHGDADFWVLYYENVSVPVGFSSGYEQGAIGLAHYVNGQVVSSDNFMVADPFMTAKSVDLDITTAQGRLNFAYAALWNNDTRRSGSIDFSAFKTKQGPTVPARLETGTRTGAFEEGTASAIFRRLEWTTVNEQNVTVLPAGSAGRVLVRLVARPSVIRSAADAAKSSALQLPAARTPAPDFQTYFWLVPAAGGYGPRSSGGGGTISSGGGGVISSGGGGVISSGGGGVISSGGGGISSGKGPYLSAAKTLGGNLL